jgi:hypothetical protein
VKYKAHHIDVASSFHLSEVQLGETQTDLSIYNVGTGLIFRVGDVSLTLSADGELSVDRTIGGKRHTLQRDLSTGAVAYYPDKPFPKINNREKVVLETGLTM